MASEIKISANRKNAQRSTGPRTSEGKQAVSQNAVTHGLRSRNAVLLMENHPEFNQLTADFREEWHPATPTEEDLVEQMVIDKWKLARYEAVESHACMQSSLIHLALQDPREFLTEKGTVRFPSLDCKREADAERTLIRISQQISRIERSYFRALQVLQRLQDRRQKQIPKQPESAAQSAPVPVAKPKVLTAGAMASAAPKPAAAAVPVRRRAPTGS